MNMIYNVAEDFLTGDIWILPTDRDNLLELNENGCIKLVRNIPVLRILATPSIKKTVSRLAYTIKDKMTMFKGETSGWMKNLINYLHKTYFDKKSNNYYKAKKAWYRFIGDLFKNIRDWEFNKVRGKIIALLRILNPVLVFDIHNTTKWNYTTSFVKFIKELKKNNITVVLRCPLESMDHVKELFKESRINNIATIKYYGKTLGHTISAKVAKYLIEISNGNLDVIRLILKHSKRELKSLRELRIHWLKIIPEIVPKKYRKIMKLACKLKKFNIKNIGNYLNFSLSTTYNYMNELVELGLLTKRKVRKNVLFKIRIDKDSLLNVIGKYNPNNLHEIFLINSKCSKYVQKNTFLKKKGFSTFRTKCDYIE